MAKQPAATATKPAGNQPAAAKATKTAMFLRVVSKRDGFRRAGMAHTEAETFHRLSKLSKDQVAALKAEPMLIVDEVERPVDGT